MAASTAFRGVQSFDRWEQVNAILRVTPLPNATSGDQTPERGPGSFLLVRQGDTSPEA